jgi:hypothetical protein
MASNYHNLTQGLLCHDVKCLMMMNRVKAKGPQSTGVIRQFTEFIRLKLCVRTSLLDQ